MTKRVAHNSPQTPITRRRIICAQTVFPSKYKRYATRIRGVGCAHCSPIARFGFNASDAFSLALLDIRPERSLRQAGLQSRDRVLAVKRHSRCRPLAVCRMNCFGEQEPKTAALSASRRRQLPTQTPSLAAAALNDWFRQKPPCSSRGRAPHTYDRSSVESGMAGSTYLPHQELSMLHGDMAMPLC
jgi:hypothetical protein